MTFTRPHTNPDPALPQNWRASTAPGGTPGTTDAVTFTGNPLADDNADGISNPVACAIGASPPHCAAAKRWDIPFNPAAEDVNLISEWSTDMVTWMPATTLFTSDTITGPLRRLVSTSPVPHVRVMLRVRLLKP